MKKSILFGALAMFAIGAMGIQSANAQNPEVKTKPTSAKTVSIEKAKPADSKVAQEPVKQKKDDCCGSKAVSADKKKRDCCADKQCDKKVKPEVKKMNKDGKKARKNEAVKLERKKEKAVKSNQTDK